MNRHPVGLNTCDREPIHIPGSIQPFGFLLALDRNLRIVAASASAATFLKQSAEDLFGLRLHDVFRADAVRQIVARLEMLAGPDAVERMFGVQLTEDEQAYDVAAHISGLNVIIEAEPSAPDAEVNSGNLVRGMLERLRHVKSFEHFVREAAREMKILTGFDRVMIYRFEHDGAGEVIAEAASPGLESYLGLHYPASDIPKQARLLYTRNWLRIIADVKAEPSPLVSISAARHDPLDLSMSVLRSVSPIHIEYLTNMGVGASMSVSILRDGKLWGLFACHHYGPHLISFERRTAAELFGQMFSWLLEARENEQTVEYEARARHMQERIIASMGSESDAETAIGRFAREFVDIIACDGVGVWNDGRVTLSGATPTEEQFTDLVRFLNRTLPGRIYATHQLGAVYSEGEKMAGNVAGILAVPISRSPRDYLMFFRTEVSRSVTWAGDPSKPVVAGPHGARLTPRKSFEAWREIVRGQSVPWRDADVRIAEQLRITLLEVILRLVDVADKERRASQERQELLIAELNHRVRNILSLIRGLISQSRATSASVEEFAAVVGGRIQALGRAHDQLTRHNFAPGALDILLKSEAAAYLGDKIDRVRLAGPDIALDPKAFSTLALVIHEMMTNSAKYGALCDSTGAVDVSWHLDTAQRLIIEWREKGGPVVHPPTRRGFGTTIIERSIPFDLNGEAEVKFDLLGLQARFVIPPAFLHMNSPGEQADAESNQVQQRVSGNALIVEDNLIIAVNAEAILLDLGADQVEIAGSVKDALQLIARRKPDFAMLDLNLGAETSLPVAEQLVALGIPFIFATGYGDRAPIPAEMADVPVIQKPYLTEVIQAALARMKR